MALKNADTLELLDRVNYLLSRYVPLAADLAPKLEEFGRYRKELQAIVVELNERGVTPEEPDGLRELLEAEEEEKDE